jgi:hypothetical protein
VLKFIKGIASLSILLTSLSAQAEIKKEVVEYKDGDATYEGYLVYNDAITAYNKAADERSWAAFMTFLNEVAPLPRSL